MFGTSCLRLQIVSQFSSEKKLLNNVQRGSPAIGFLGRFKFMIAESSFQYHWGLL